MQENKCICCDYVGALPVKKTFPGFLFGQPFAVASCPQCGLGMTVPPPVITPEYYVENQRYDELFMQKAPLYRTFAANLLSVLEGIVNAKGARLLDIGCGGGFMVEEAGKKGFAAEGVDANAGIVAWCQQRGLKVFQANVLDMDLAIESKYDVVVLSAVLEHLQDPDILLTHVRQKLLKAGGLVLVSQASYDGLLPRVFSWGWYGWQPQEHFWHFTPEAMEKLANKTGYRVVTCKRNALHHPWFVQGNVKELLGRNLAAVLGRLGNIVGMGDSFDMLLQA